MNQSFPSRSGRKYNFPFTGAISRNSCEDVLKSQWDYSRAVAKYFVKTSSNTEHKEFSRNFFTIDATVTKSLQGSVTFISLRK